MQEFEIIAKTFQGLEEVLAQEITELGAKNIKTGRRMVSFTGDQEMLYRANFCLRTAVRVLKPLKHFKAEDADQVYEAVKTIAWDEYLDLQTTFAVDAVVYSQEFRHSKFVAYKTKDAIVDYFREKEGKRPNISIANPDLKLNIHIADNDCTLSLDASGESLHLRGYRTASCEAPINEVLAAGLIKLSGWNFDTDFIDPFCGSSIRAFSANRLALKSGKTLIASCSIRFITTTAKSVSSLIAFTATTSTALRSTAHWKMQKQPVWQTSLRLSKRTSANLRSRQSALSSLRTRLTANDSRRPTCWAYIAPSVSG